MKLLETFGGVGCELSVRDCGYLNGAEVQQVRQALIAPASLLVTSS